MASEPCVKDNLTRDWVLFSTFGD